jgi:plastocyanin
MKKFVAMLALLLVALALVACGGGSDTTSEDSATAPETTKEAEGGTADAGTIEIEADPDGAIAYTADELTAKAGKVTINFTNQSSVPHDIRMTSQSGKIVAETEVLTEGTDSTTVNLKPGTYTYYCTVAGHTSAGMEGTLTVK